MLLVSVVNRHFLSLIIIKAVILILLIVLVFFPLLETVGYRLVLHDIDGIGTEGSQKKQVRFMGFIMHDFKRM